MKAAPRRPEVAAYRRNASNLTDREVLHASEKADRVKAAPRIRRRAVREQFERTWAEEERKAAGEAGAVLGKVREGTQALAGALGALETLKLPGLIGKVESEQQRVRSATTALDSAAEALGRGDFGAAGAAVEQAETDLRQVGGPLVVALNEALGRAAVGRAERARLESNLAERRQAKTQLESARGRRNPAALAIAARLHQLDADGFRLAAEIIGRQAKRAPAASRSRSVGREGEVRVLGPSECETFADIGGLGEVKERLRETLGAILEQPDQAARYRVVHNGLLLHGPPGTGKNLLSRSIAGEYGLRYIRFSPAAIASAYIHEAATNLRRLFEIARENVPCVLFLDEIDAIAGDRGEQPSADHREVVTQLMICLEEYRMVPGLVVVAATNDIDRLDPGLREGRFDARILLPLPDPEARADILQVHLERRGDATAWKGIDLAELARMTAGYNAAALENIVSMAVQSSLRSSALIGQEALVKAIRERGGKDRGTVEQRLAWDDVVLADDTRERLMEILNAFSHPDLARDVGVSVPPGILLHGPPGTGKTTIAKAIASEVDASFYEQSAAEMLSKWAGESEQRVSKLFARARANRPSIIFIDEVDTLLRRRRDNSAAPWEERVVSQFLRELDGLTKTEQVLLVCATNRLDIIDEAVAGRRLVSIEVGLPDPTLRLKLLRLLCHSVKLSSDVNLRAIAAATEGMSGADLKRIRDAAGMKALNRSARSRSTPSRTTRTPPKAAITMADLTSALDVHRRKTSLAEV